MIDQRPPPANRWFKSGKCNFHRPRCVCELRIVIIQRINPVFFGVGRWVGFGRRQIDKVGDGAAAADRRCCDLWCRGDGAAVS